MVYGCDTARPTVAPWLTSPLPAPAVDGTVLSMLLVRQGTAYAGLAGRPPVTGLYMSILCLLGYAVSGPSRVLVPAPGSSLGPVIAATILPLTGAEGDAKRVTATSRPPTSSDPPGPMRMGHPTGPARVKL
jgi:MFS superfamily sulfate permease-like transporter